MRLHDVCTEENLSWEETLCKVYQYTDEVGIPKTVFRYQIPFPPDKETVFLNRYRIPVAERLQVYQTIVRCIERQVAVSKYLASFGLSSILTYSRIEQEKDSGNVINIYLESEQVRPILDRVLGNSVPYMTLLEVISRLSLVLRDISKPEVNVVHRGLDLCQIYINENNRILVGGFFYADCPQLGAYPAYLPCSPPHIPELLKSGAVGSPRSDVYTLSKIAWNLFSGIPYDAEWATKRLAAPEYAYGDLSRILFDGMQLSSEDTGNSFRKQINDHRKQIMRENISLPIIPVRTAQLKEVSITWVTNTSDEVE